MTQLTVELAIYDTKNIGGPACACNPPHQNEVTIGENPKKIPQGTAYFLCDARYPRSNLRLEISKNDIGDDVVR